MKAIISPTKEWLSSGRVATFRPLDSLCMPNINQMEKAEHRGGLSKLNIVSILQNKAYLKYYVFNVISI
jgi:hypothetical protein